MKFEEIPLTAPCLKISDQLTLNSCRLALTAHLPRYVVSKKANPEGLSIILLLIHNRLAQAKLTTVRNTRTLLTTLLTHHANLLTNPTHHPTYSRTYMFSYQLCHLLLAQ